MKIKVPKNITNDLAEVFGAIVGDGYIRSKSNWWLFVETSSEERSYIDDHLIPLFNKVFDLNLKGRYFNRNGLRNTYGFYICSKELVVFLQSFDLDCSHNIIRIPKGIRKNRNKGIWASFIRGYADTDGCISFYKPNGKSRHTYPRIQVNSTSKILIMDFRHLLENLGFRGSYWKTGIFNKCKNVPHRYEIKGSIMIEKWIKDIGFGNSVKLSKYLVWKKYGILPPYTTHEERIKMLKGYINPDKYYLEER